MGRVGAGGSSSGGGLRRRRLRSSKQRGSGASHGNGDTGRQQHQGGQREPLLKGTVDHGRDQSHNQGVRGRCRMPGKKAPSWLQGMRAKSKVEGDSIERFDRGVPRANKRLKREGRAKDTGNGGLVCLEQAPRHEGRGRGHGRGETQRGRRHGRRPPLYTRIRGFFCSCSWGLGFCWRNTKTRASHNLRVNFEHSLAKNSKTGLLLAGFTSPVSDAQDAGWRFILWSKFVTPSSARHLPF